METGNSTRRAKCVVGTLIVGVLVVIALVIALTYMYAPEIEEERAVVTLAPSTSTTKEGIVGAKRAMLEENRRRLHADLSREEFKLNAYAKLLYHFVDTMEAKDCYVCMRLPSSVDEGMTYHHLPLTYGISCSILLSLFYDQGHFEYFFSNVDTVLSEVPVFKNKNKYDYYKEKERVGSFFVPAIRIDTVHAHKNHLTCLLTEIEKKFIMQVEDRYAEAMKNVRNTEGILDWTEEEKTHRKKGSNGPIALDQARKGKLCIRRDKTYYDKSDMGISECDHIFRVDKLAEKFLHGNIQVIPTVYYVCGQNAYVRLPEDWYGTCYLATVFPQIYHTENLEAFENDIKKFRRKRDTDAGGVVGDIFGAMIPSLGVVLNDLKIRKLALVLDKFSANTANSLHLVSGEMQSIRTMVMQNRLALDVLLAKEGGVCKLLKVQECCTYIPDDSKEIEKYISNITDVHKELKSLTEGGGIDLLEGVGKGLGAVGNWLTGLGKGFLGYILKPLIIVIICVILVWGLFRSFKWYKSSLAQRRLRQREARLERLQDSQYKRMQIIERYRQKPREATTSV